jgi:hypothetical protein
VDPSGGQPECATLGGRRRSARWEWAGFFLMAAAAAGLLIVLALWIDSIGTIVPELRRGATPIGLYLYAASVLAAALLVAGTLAWGEAYLATLWAVSPLLPGVASLGIIVIYLSTAATSLVHREAVFTGSVVAVGMWLVSGALLRMLATAPTAQVRSYSELLQRTSNLMVRAGHRQPPEANSPGRGSTVADCDSLPPVHPSFPPEIHADLDLLGCELGLYGRPGAGLRYVSANGYMTLWRTLHQAEATALEVDCVARVVEAATYDYFRLIHSQIPNREALIRDLQLAVATLDPSAVVYLSDPTDADAVAASKGPPANAAPSSDSKPSTASAGEAAAAAAAGVVAMAVESVLAVPLKAVAWLATVTGLAGLVRHAKANGAPTRTPETARTPKTARAIIKTVRLSVVEYRDTQWDELIRARNRLLRSILLGATAGYVLTVVAVVGRANPAAVAAATAFYFVGGAVGLLARLLIEGRSHSAVDDYGLFEARLLHIPLVGGLAAVFGVVLVAFAAKAATGVADDSTDLTKIFSVTDVRSLVTAAAFGLAPSVLIAGLNENVASIKNSLTSSEAAGGTASASDQTPT